MAVCMRAERVSFYDWLIRKIEGLQAQYSDSDDKAIQAVSDLLTRSVSNENQMRSGYGAAVMKAAGNSLAGLLKYARQLEPFYTEIENAMKLPQAEFQPAIEDIQERMDASSNLLLHEFLPAATKVRLREFRITARLAMLHAAYQLRLDSATGLGQVFDPFGTGPFVYSRFILDGVDHGFKLKSELKVPDFDEVLIFAEKPGPAFYIDGPKAGEEVP